MNRLYALRHRDAQTYMPLLKFNRGYSHWEPGEEGVGVIRLFHSKAAANSARVAWAAGKFSVGYSDGYFGPPEPELDVTPVPGRTKTSLEIVPVTVKFEAPIG